MVIKTTEADKKKWGPYCWYLLHLIAYKLGTDKLEDNSRVIKFFNHLHRIIPCPKCKDHYKEWLNKNPITPKTNLVQWTIACHNNVNKMNNKPILVESQVYQQFWIKALDGPDVLPVNHQFIVKLLQVLGNYHEEMGMLDVFKDFLYELRKVIPCDECQKQLKKNKDGDIEDYFNIISTCGSQKKLIPLIGAQNQRYKV